MTLNAQKLRRSIVDYGGGLLKINNDLFFQDTKIDQDSITSVSKIEDFPAPVNGVITIKDGAVFIVNGKIDTKGNAFNLQGVASFVGDSSLGSLLYSSVTLISSSALLVSSSSLEIRDISLACPLGQIFNLNAALNPGQSIFLNNANFGYKDTTLDLSAGTIGSVIGYENFVMSNSDFVKCVTGFTFSGTMSSIVFRPNCYFTGVQSGGTAITISSGMIIQRRLIIRDNSFNIASGATALNVSPLAIINAESYIISHCFFNGAGSYLSGLAHTSPKSKFSDNFGISNSSSIGYMTMTGNAIATTVLVNTPTKASGTPIQQPITQRFTVSGNRIVYDGLITKRFNIEVIATMTSGNNQELGLHIYHYKAFTATGAINTAFKAYSTTNGVGKTENNTTQYVVDLQTNDYIEVWVENKTAATAITITDLSCIIREA